MLTVKLTQSSSIDPQDTVLESVVNPPYWAPETAVSFNLTIPTLDVCPVRVGHRVAFARALSS